MQRAHFAANHWMEHDQVKSPQLYGYNGAKRRLF